MNEQDRADFAIAEEEYDALALPGDAMDRIEIAWADGEYDHALDVLTAQAPSLTREAAAALLRRVYGCGP